MQPLISVIIPNYNGAKYLKQCLDSVVSQDYANKEIIVVDGYSTDGSWDIIKEYPSIITVLAEPKGEPDAINLGIQCSHGEILTFMDSDDYYLPHALSIAADCFTSNDNEWAYSSGKVADADGKETRKLMMAVKRFLMKHYNYEVLRTVDFFLTPGVFWRRILWDRIGNFRTNEKFTYEYEWWLRAGRNHEPAFINSDIGVWRMHKDSITSSNLKQNAVDALRIQGEYTGWGLLRLVQYLSYCLTRLIYLNEKR